MRVSSSSMFLAALASSTSLTQLAAAAPTSADSTPDNSMTAPSDPAPASGGAPAPDLSLILSGLPTSSTRRDLDYSNLEARGGLFDALAGLSPVVAQVLSLLGLLKKGPTTASIDSVGQLTPDQVTHITDLVRNMTEGVPFLLPVPIPAPGNGTGPGNSTNSTASHSNARRAKPDWKDQSAGDHQAAAIAELPVREDIQSRNDHDWRDDKSDSYLLSPEALDTLPPSSSAVGASGLPFDAAGLPIQPPVPAPLAPPVPPAAPGNGTSNSTNSTGPSPPAGPPAPPSGFPLPTPPVTPPNPPSLPPNLPVTPPTPPKAASVEPLEAPPLFSPSS